MDKDEREEELFLWRERAAIMEYDGGLPRVEAEIKAMEWITARRLYGQQLNMWSDNE